jgi:solute carrier family 25 carnitine/acylcarnitine transporter 20/29
MGGASDGGAAARWQRWSGPGGRAEQVAPLVAGWFAGATSIVVGQPFDLFKTRLQVGVPLRELSHRADLAQSLRRVYRGVLPPLLTVGLVGSLHFTLYEGCKRRLLARERERAPGAAVPIDTYLRLTLVSGSFGGAWISLITIPTGLVKVQQQVLSSVGMVATARNLVRAHGWKVMYRGFLPGFLMEFIGRGVYICTFEAVKAAQLDAQLAERLAQGELVEVPLRAKLLAAACAGTMGWLAVYPCDVVKSVMYADAGGARLPTFLAAARHLYREGGVPRFFRGLRWSLLRASPVAASVLPMYEYSRDALARQLARLDHY